MMEKKYHFALHCIFFIHHFTHQSSLTNQPVSRNFLVLIYKKATTERDKAVKFKSFSLKGLAWSVNVIKWMSIHNLLIPCSNQPPHPPHLATKSIFIILSSATEAYTKKYTSIHSGSVSPRLNTMWAYKHAHAHEWNILNLM